MAKEQHSHKIQQHQQAGLKKQQIIFAIFSLIIICLACLLICGSRYKQILSLHSPIMLLLPLIFKSVVTVSSTILISTAIHIASTVTPKPPPNPIWVSVSTSPDYVNYILQGIYDFLTLILVFVSIISIIKSRQQSEKALKAVYAQIDESKKQAQESIYNQNKPILVCSGIDEVRGHMPLKIKNVGVGVATNIWGLVTTKEQAQYASIYSSVLAADSEIELDFELISTASTQKDFEGFPILPTTNEKHFNRRLIITYHDIFDYRHLSIFDFSERFGWKQVIIKRDINQTLEQIIINEIKEK